MDNETKTKYMDIVKTMQESLIPSPDDDIYLQHNDDQKWSGTEYNASGSELEHFVDNIKDFGIPAVANVGDTGEFGNGWVQITYLHEESSKKNEDDIKFRAYKLDFQCDVSLIMCLYQEGDMGDDYFDCYEENCNFYDIETGSRDPSDESHGYFSEMSDDVGALESFDEDDED
jgi:hypothetical protein